MMENYQRSATSLTDLLQIQHHPTSSIYGQEQGNLLQPRHFFLQTLVLISPICASSIVLPRFGGFLNRRSGCSL
jgi:hypothetical protein